MKIDKDNVDKITVIKEPYYELIKDLMRLKQRMTDTDEGRSLADYIKYEQSPKIERNPTIKKEDLYDFPKQVAEMLGFDKFMEYQIKSWEYINSNFANLNKSLIIDAGTGFGKTEAAVPALIKKVLDEDDLAILIFPRRALLIDQIQRMIKYDVEKMLKIAIQFSGINQKIEWTIYNSDQQRVSRIKGFDKKINKIEYLAHTNYHFETDLFNVDYINANSDKIQINLFKCKCGGSFGNIASFRAGRDGRYEKHLKFAGMNNNNNYNWKCDKCGKKLNVAFSREDQIELKPNILLTTIDSLLSIISDPDMGQYIKDKLKAIVFDEVHVYNSSYGAHAVEIIKKINEITDRKILMIGLSATIDLPELFGSKLFQSDVEVIEPTPKDLKKIEEKERYVFIKSSTYEGISGDDIYSLKTQNMIQTTLLLASTINKKTLAFMDSIDAVESLSRQTMDAYNDKKLYKFRLDELLSKRVNYEVWSCSGLTDNCMLTCEIYKKGECWNILRRMNGLSETPGKIDIKWVHAGALISAEALQNATIIFSTSELQLGIDLPDVDYLIQYGTPYTIFDYIQRKGRAGRAIGSEPVFLFVLGESSNDYIYFSYGSSILNKKYILPLEEKNEVLKKLYNELFKYYENVNNEYDNIKNEYSVDRIYIAKFRSSWEALFKGSLLDPGFQTFLKENFDTSSYVFGIKDYNDVKEFKKLEGKVKSLMDSKINDLRKKLEPFKNQLPSQYLQEEIQKIIQELGHDPSMQQEIKNIVSFKNKVIDDIENNRNSLDDELQLSMELGKLKQKVFGSDLAVKISEIDSELTKHATTQNPNNNIQQEARELFFTIQSLKELGTAFPRNLTSEIVKYMLRANYFYILPKLLSQNVTKSLPVIPPINMFSTSSREIALVNQTGYNQSGNTENIDIRDAIFKYFPYRLNAMGSNKYKKIVNPRIERNGNKYYFDPIEIIDPVHFNYSYNKNAIMPLSLKVTTIQDDGINGIISYCTNCNSFQEYSESTCSICSKKLSKVSLYTERRDEYNVSVSEWNPVFGKISYSEASEVTILLNGVNVILTYQYYDADNKRYKPTRKRDPLEIDSRIPYGYQITTHSLKIEIDQSLVQSLCGNFKNKFPNRGNSDSFVNEIVMHTLSHLWLKAIAITVGISPDQFIYKWENSGIIISELQEGGAGHLKAFIEYLKFRTKEVFNSMSEIIRCEEHQSIFSNKNKKRFFEEFTKVNLNQIHLYEHQKIMEQINSNPSFSFFLDEYPVCYDGCPYCIGLTSCTHGGDTQFDCLSLEVATEYVNSVKKITSDKNSAASLVTQGGVIIDEDVDNYVIFLL